MSTISLSSLSPEDRKKLQQESLAEYNKGLELITENRKAYKKMVNDEIPGVFARLKELSSLIAKAKTETFNDLKALIEMKQDVYGKDGDQYTHSFTTEDGITIIVGNRITDGWEDTVTAGLAKMDKYLASLGKDENSQMLIRVIKKLLAKDAKGNLKSSRVISLKNEAEKSGNAEFIDAINIIMSAYQPRKSRQFVTVKYRDEKFVQHDLALDITAAEIINEKEAVNE